MTYILHHHTIYINDPKNLRNAHIMNKSHIGKRIS